MDVSDGKEESSPKEIVALNVFCPACEGDCWDEVEQGGLKVPKFKCKGCGEVFTRNELVRWVKRNID